MSRLALLAWCGASSGVGVVGRVPRVRENHTRKRDHDDDDDIDDKGDNKNTSNDDDSSSEDTDDDDLWRLWHTELAQACQVETFVIILLLLLFFLHTRTYTAFFERKPCLQTVAVSLRRAFASCPTAHHVVVVAVVVVVGRVAVGVGVDDERCRRAVTTHVGDGTRLLSCTK